MDRQEISERISILRELKNVSAREMSLTLDQSESYINRIENSANLPSMEAFFNICDYFEITPAEFFFFTINNPDDGSLDILRKIKKLDARDIRLLSALADVLASR